MRGWVGVLVLLLASCVQTSSVSCPDGTLCPEGTSCKSLPSLGKQICAAPGDLGVCDGLAEGADCLDKTGNCRDGVCLHHCGDGIRTGAEECDGADLGKNATCADLGYYDPVPLKCTPDCTYDLVGNYDPSARCTGFCGDQQVNGPEVCEDDLGWTNARSCVDYGFDVGPMACARCGPAFSSCREIGWKRSFGTPSDLFVGLQGRAHDDIWAISTDYRAFHFDGSQWTEHSPQLPSPIPPYFSGFQVDAAGNAWVLDSNQHLLHWNGTAWSSSVIPGLALSEIPTALWMSTNGNGWAVGGGGLIVKITNGAGAKVASPTSVSLLSVWGASASDVWATGDSGVLLHYDGSSWQTSSFPSTRALIQVYGSGSNNVWIATDTGVSNVLFHNTGSGWQSVTPAITTQLGFKVWTTAPDDVWIIGEDHAAHFDGTIWVPMLMPKKPRILWGSARDDLWLAGEGAPGAGVLYHQGGTAWGQWPSASVPVSPAYSLLFDGSVLWAGGKEGLADFRTQWTPHAPPTFGSSLVELWSPGGTTILAANNGIDIDGNPFGEVDRYGGSSISVDHTTPLPANTIWGSSATDIWAGTSADVGQHLLFHFTQGAWSSVDPATPLMGDVLSLFGFGAADIWAGTSYGELVHYNGSTWSTVYTGGYMQPFRGIWGTGSSNVWAVGDTTMHYNGSTWTAVAPPDPYAHICGTSASDVFAVGPGGAFGHFDGTTWTRIRFDLGDPTSITCSTHHIFIGLQDGGVADLQRITPW